MVTASLKIHTLTVNYQNITKYSQKTSLYKLVLAKFTDGKQADLNLNVQIGLFALPAVLRFLV